MKPFVVEFHRGGVKVLRRLADAVGFKCRLTLANGEVVSGVLRGFKYGSSLILYIVGNSRTFVNFHYVVKMTVEE